MMMRKAGLTLGIALTLGLCLGSAGLAAAPQNGDPAPAFTLKTLDGKTMTRDSLKGKVVVIDFWATWCGPCIKALPEIKELRQKNAGQPLVVVSVSVDEQRAPVEEFVRKNGMDWPQVWDNQGQLAGKVFQVASLPSYVVIDAQGRIAYRQKGWAPMSSAALLSQAVSRALDTVCKPSATADKPC
jgi:thiol-disulfide isomerase/thioredoxin